jgi:uncharacterized protein
MLTLVCSLLIAALSEAPASPAPTWRQKLEVFAKEHLEHPAWGTAHARRDYNLTLQLAELSKMTVDEEAIFAASLLHDIGAIEGYSKPGTEHMARALELIDPILIDSGFPKEKIPLVRAIVSHHMYFSDPAGQPAEAVLFRDADTLDFLGAIGVTRIFALTGKHRWATDIDVAEATVRKNAAELPARLTTAAARGIGETRAKEMNEFLARLAGEKGVTSATRGVTSSATSHDADCTSN